MINATATPQELLAELKLILEEHQAAADSENAFFFEQQKLSKKPLKYFETVMQNPNETEFNKNVACLLYCHEHAFLEVYAGRRLTETAFLQSLTNIVELLENKIKEC
jgi:hypothetical protein